MICISATGGSGSSFVARAFKNAGWKICLRPDAGSQKGHHTTLSGHFKDRVRGFFNVPERDYSEEVMANLTIKNLQERKKTLLLCMVWGGMGLLKEVKDVVYLVRSPYFAFNSYSGAGWRPEGGLMRIASVGAADLNDPKWIDAFFGWFSHWLAGAKYALKAHKAGKGYIVRYHRFAEDWGKLPLDVPPIHKYFKSKDDYGKIAGMLPATTDKITQIAGDTWQEIMSL